MDVDGEEENDDDEAGGDTEEDEPSQMSVDEDGENGTPKKTKKNDSRKLKPRKSQLDVTALTKEQEALAAYDERDIPRLRLQKRYYSDAMTFIDQIENAMVPMCKLLGSTSKPEVLEIMDFFRIAHEYKFETAKVSI